MCEFIPAGCLRGQGQQDLFKGLCSEQRHLSLSQHSKCVSQTLSLDGIIGGGEGRMVHTLNHGAWETEARRLPVAG